MSNALKKSALAVGLFATTMFSACTKNGSTPDNSQSTNLSNRTEVFLTTSVPQNVSGLGIGFNAPLGTFKGMATFVADKDDARGTHYALSLGYAHSNPTGRQVTFSRNVILDSNSVADASVAGKSGIFGYNNFKPLQIDITLATPFTGINNLKSATTLHITVPSTSGIFEEMDANYDKDSLALYRSNMSAANDNFTRLINLYAHDTYHYPNANPQSAPAMPLAVGIDARQGPK